MLYVDESDGYEEKFIFKHAIKVAESFDDAVHKEIIGIAREKGFTSLLLLNKEDIAEALAKQIPKKPNIHGYREGREINTISYTCPICNKHIGRENYCKHCGQALDWKGGAE